MEYITAGESHGPVLTAIVSGVPAGLAISEKAINSDLARRQSGYGRGGRQAIEKDKVSVTFWCSFWSHHWVAGDVVCCEPRLVELEPSACPCSASLLKIWFVR